MIPMIALVKAPHASAILGGLGGFLGSSTAGVSPLVGTILGAVVLLGFRLERNVAALTADVAILKAGK